MWSTAALLFILSIIQITHARMPSRRLVRAAITGC
jgi:hypothetical protein